MWTEGCWVGGRSGGGGCSGGGGRRGGGGDTGRCCNRCIVEYSSRSRRASRGFFNAVPALVASFVACQALYLVAHIIAGIARRVEGKGCGGGRGCCCGRCGA